MRILWGSTAHPTPCLLIAFVWLYSAMWGTAHHRLGHHNIHTHARTHRQTHTHTQANTRAHAHTHTHKHTHTHRQTHARTHTHTHTHTHTNEREELLGGSWNETPSAIDKDAC